MPSEAKRIKRLKRLSSFVEYGDLNRLKYYLKREKYSKLDLSRAVVNKKNQTLLHVACRFCQPEIVKFLLDNSICDVHASDYKENLPLHLALKSILRIVGKREFVKAYQNLILSQLTAFSTSLDEVNRDGQTVRFLLDAADSVYQSHTREIPVPSRRDDAEEDWKRKIAAEMEDEYQDTWGQYETDFSQNLPESESYDSWADRMIYEHRRKHSNIPKSSKPQASLELDNSKPSSWTAEDQSQFLKKEEARKRQMELEKLSQLRLLFLSKLRNMVRSEGTINSNDLPFNCGDQVSSICQHILFDVKEMKDAEERRKALRELKRLWHPDKFAQKFNQRLADEIREKVAKKVTEIAQYLNSYDCSNPVNS